MSATAAWAGIIVSDAARSADWYVARLGAAISERDEGWVKLAFPNATAIELFSGDREDPGSTFPSYGLDPGPPVLPGYAVEDPHEVAEQRALEVARTLPGWVVVVAPDRLRVVLTGDAPGRGLGLVGFRFRTVLADEQRSFLAGLPVAEPVVEDGHAQVVPVVRCRQPGEVEDPDGTVILRVS